MQPPSATISHSPRSARPTPAHASGACATPPPPHCHRHQHRGRGARPQGPCGLCCSPGPPTCSSGWAPRTGTALTAPALPLHPAVPEVRAPTRRASRPPLGVPSPRWWALIRPKLRSTAIVGGRRRGLGAAASLGARVGAPTSAVTAGCGILGSSRLRPPTSTHTPHAHCPSVSPRPLSLPGPLPWKALLLAHTRTRSSCRLRETQQ